MATRCDEKVEARVKTGWRLWSATIMIAMLLVACGAATPTAAPTKPAAAGKSQAVAPSGQGKQYSSPPAMTIDPAKKHTAVLMTTKGAITIELFANEAPATVNNFVFLAREGFYENTVFHRVIKNFMIQGGDPTGTGAGGPGYRFPDEPIKRDYTRGIVAMANAGANTNGSQFFIMHADRPLPKNYVIFGQVTDGMDVVDAIASAPVVVGSEQTPSKPVEPVRVTKVEIREG